MREWGDIADLISLELQVRQIRQTGKRTRITDCIAIELQVCQMRQASKRPDVTYRITTHN